MKIDKLEVREFRLEDSNDVVGWMNRSPLDLFNVSSGFEFPLSEKMFSEYYQKSNPNERKLYSVFLEETRQHIGHFEIKNINLRHSIGTGAHIILSPEFRGKALGKNLVSLLNYVGFEVLGLYRLGVSVHTHNIPAIATYLSAGYLLEGIVREVLLFEGRRYSLYQMGLLTVEWKNGKNPK